MSTVADNLWNTYLLNAGFEDMFVCYFYPKHFACN